MINRLFVYFISAVILLTSAGYVCANDVVEIAGVEFQKERIIEGKKLKLNGVSVLKKYGFVKVYAAGLYLEKPTDDPNEIINSEQIKYMHVQYLTDKATKSKIQNAFVALITEHNTGKVVTANMNEIERFTSWLDADMAPGFSSETIYVPNKGLTLFYQGEIKGTIIGSDFAKMYYRYNVGSKVEETFKKGLLGLK